MLLPTSRTVSAFALSILCIGSIAGAQVKVDPKIPDYKTVPGVSGSIKSAGSQTLSNLMTMWLEGFKSIYPGVMTAIEAKGSGSAPPALISGAASFGPMSRAMQEQEIAAFGLVRIFVCEAYHG